MTPPPFAVLVGDMQATLLVERLVGYESNAGPRRRMFEELRALAAPFMLFMGDMVCAPWAREWELIGPLVNALKSQGTVVRAALGNHDIMFQPSSGLRRLRAEELIPAQGDIWTSYDREGVRFCVIDTNPYALAKLRLDAQRRWLEAELMNADSDPSISHVVVVGHHPPFTNARLPLAAERGIHELVRVFDQGRKAQLWMSGHVHAYERFLVGGKHFVVAGSAGAPRVQLRTGAQQKKQSAMQLRTPAPFLWTELRLLPSGDLACNVRGFQRIDAEVRSWDQWTIAVR